MSFFIPLEDQPPSIKAQAFAVREQILTSLAQSAQQRSQQEQMQHRMAIKMKRRIRKSQKRGR